MSAQIHMTLKITHRLTAVVIRIVNARSRITVRIEEAIFYHSPEIKHPAEAFIVTTDVDCGGAVAVAIGIALRLGVLIEGGIGRQGAAGAFEGICRSDGEAVSVGG